jgi:hypothetical protein
MSPQLGTGPRVQLGFVMAELHDSEINGQVSWFFDGDWRVATGDVHNGIGAEATVSSPEEAAEWLCWNAIRLYPKSRFAKLFARRVFVPGTEGCERC